MNTRKVLAGLALTAAIAAQGGPKIIFDTDMVSDYDDVGAIAALHAMADAGQCEILAMGSCSRGNSSVAAVEIFNAFYGRPDIPVGCSKDIGVVVVPQGHNPKGHQKYVDLAAAYPEWVKHANSDDAPDATDVYRKALAAAPDRSVIICSVGFLTNMRRLLESKPDAHSKLDGRALVAKKVQCWYLMGCRHPDQKEYNIVGDVASARIAIEKWPTPIIFSDWNYGTDVYSGRRVAETEYAFRNPVKDIFAKCLPPRGSGKGGVSEGHESWDEVTVFAAVRCGLGIFGKSIGQTRFFNIEKGTYKIAEDGASTWVADEKSRNCRLLESAGKERFNTPKWTIGYLLDELIARVPKCRRTDDAITDFRRSNLEKTATGVKMLRDGKTLWNFEIDNPEGRPFFHPLNLPSGKPLTDVRPKDHIWHLGYWFSWKLINGVNYWEPGDAARKGVEPAGRTRVTKKSMSIDGLDCMVRLELDYAPRATGKTALKESRTVTIDPPDPKGGYIITVRHTFTAVEDVTLDRTPPHGSTASGKWGGGYAGATLRLDPAQAAAFAVRGFAGGRTSADVTGKETKYVDFTDPATGEGATFTQLVAPPTGKFYVWPDRRMVNPSPVYDGPLALKAGEKLELAYKLAVHADKTVKGALAQRPVEKLDRGLVASVTAKGTYLSWRMLDTDPADKAFDVWRQVDGKTEKLTAQPIVQTSDFWLPGYVNADAKYSVDGKDFVPVTCFAKAGESPYQLIRLANTNDAPTLVGVGDLDGDGKYDFVIKTPRGGTDPWDLVYTPAKTTCRLEAYRSDGKFLWKREHGWNIEMGAWYSPYFVADMDGDGKAEVVTKLAPLEPDYRDPDGRVQRGPEYLAILNGLTGETIATAPWPERTAPDPVDGYNHYASRNQIGLAYLDGKTPCAIVERGTYGKMIVDAFCLKNGRLERLWRFNNEFMPRRFKGQGDHAMLCCDVDADGCDEVLIGSLTLDQDGTVLWCNGRGHSDAHYYGDIDPQRPGMELFFVYETRQPQGGGLLMTDPVTGEEIWKLPVPTRHVHGSGICSDLDPIYPGLEVYGQEVDQSTAGVSKKMTHPQSDNRWFYTANGTLLSSYTNCTYRYGNGRVSIWWDADLQRETIGGGIRDHEGTQVAPGFRGGGMAVDLYGDWREEMLAGNPGELRIYTTDIPAMDRRVTLMRDKSYRSRIALETSGYSQRPILEYVPSAVSPNLSLRLDGWGRNVRIDVTAPLDKPLKGVLALDKLPEKWTVDLKPTEINLKPGEHWTKKLPIRRPPNPRGRYDFTMTLTRPGEPPLILRQPVIF